MGAAHTTTQFANWRSLHHPRRARYFASGRKEPKRATESLRSTVFPLPLDDAVLRPEDRRLVSTNGLNYVAAARYAKGRGWRPRQNELWTYCTYAREALPCILAPVCGRSASPGVDRPSRAALEVADANLELNRSKLLNNGDGVDWIEARRLRASARRYEATGRSASAPSCWTRPPSPSRRNATEGALRGYKGVNPARAE